MCLLLLRSEDVFRFFYKYYYERQEVKNIINFCTIVAYFNTYFYQINYQIQNIVNAIKRSQPQNPVLFEEAARLIHPNAVTIEIAPHGLLQAILRRSLAKDVVNIPLTQRGHEDNVQIFLTALGKYV